MKDFWPLLVEMQRHIDSGVTRRGAAVKVANKHWRVITKGKYESAVQWLQDNHRKFRDELNPRFAVLEKDRAAREERLSKLSPQERKRAELLHRFEELRQRIQHLRRSLQGEDGGPIAMCMALHAILKLRD